MSLTETNIGFKKLYDHVIVSQEEGSALELLREKAKAELSDIKRPNLKHEDWKYSSTKWLEELDWQVSHNHSEAKIELCDELLEKKVQKLIFIDGVFSKEKSSSDFRGLDIQSLNQSLLENSQALQEMHDRFKGEKKDYFTILNQAFLKEGVVIRVKENSKVTEPFELVFYWSHEKFAKTCFVKNYIIVEKNASCSVKEIHKTLDSKSVRGDLFSSSYCDILLEELSHLRYKKIFLESNDHRQISGLRVFMKEASCFKSFFVSLGGKLCRQDVLIKLSEKNSSAQVNGLYLANEKQVVDYCFNIKHEGPHTKSSQYFKGFCGENAKGVFQGNIFVGSKASQTSSKQLNKNLILGTNAQIYTKPQLRIDTDDVKCSHGATVSQVREEELFYLQTRGLSREKAMEFLIAAFCHELLELEKKEDQDVFETEIDKKTKKIILEDYKV